MSLNLLVPGRLDGTEGELKLPLPAGRGKVPNTAIKGENLQVKTKKRVQSGTEVRIRLENLKRSGWNEQMVVNRNVDRFRGGHQYPLLLHALRPLPAPLVGSSILFTALGKLGAE